MELSFARRPFFLFFGGPECHPGVPRRWGERLDALYPGGRRAIAQLGLRAGRRFDLRVELSDTMDSWRLALWAERQGRGEELLSALGRRYFEEGQRLADHGALLAAAEEAGLSAVEAKGVLASESMREEVMRHYRWAVEEQGIRSVPVFLFSDPSGSFRRAVRGSASVGEFAAVLVEALCAEGGEL